MNISIVIPNYNGEHLLKKNLPRVISETMRQGNNETVEFIVVDDGSIDGSKREIKNQIEKIKNTKQKLKIKLLENKRNLGFSSAVNRGVEEARGELVVLLNTDVYPERGFLEAILPHFNDPKVFAVGMLDKSIEKEGKNIVRRGRGIAGWRRGMYVHRRGEVNRTDTTWVSGGSGVFRKSIWKKLGGFDEIYNPFYWEDIDLSLRAIKAGYKILFESKSVVVHEHGRGIIKSNYSPRHIKAISYRNQFLFVWKNANRKQIVSHLLWLPYHVVRSFLTGDIYFFMGFLWALKRRLTFKR